MSAFATSVKVTKTVYVINGRCDEDSWTERVYENYDEAERYLVCRGYSFVPMFSVFRPSKEFVGPARDYDVCYTINEYVLY